MHLHTKITIAFCAQFLVFAAHAADKFEDIRNYIRDELVAQSVPSISVAVAQGERIVWEEGFGWADREQRRPATEHTAYSLASISKPITATGLMMLVQAGKIDLDRPINEYLGPAKLRARLGNADGATVRRVANHTSGLPLHYQFFYADEPYQRPAMDDTILRYGVLYDAPGATYAYSNLGYGVLDYVISRVSGVSYPEYMRREVFLPLGLTRTTVGIVPGSEEHIATRYGADGLPIPDYDFDHPGASAVFSSAHDLVRFGQFHVLAHRRDQKAILTDASILAMQRTPGTGVDAGYSVGFSVREDGGYRFVGHTGGMGGVSTQLRTVPSEKLVVVVLSNASSNLPKEVADRIVARMLPKWQPTAAEPYPPAPPFTPTDSLVGIWKGTLSTYTKDLPVELVIKPDGDVHMKVDNQLTSLVNRARFEKDQFSGVLNAKFGTPDTERYGYSLSLSLRLRGDVLNGGATAMGEREPRLRNALTHWIELKKEAATPKT